MMTLPIQSVKFVMPVRKFIQPRVSHHRNDKLPESGDGEKCAGAAYEPNGGPAEGEVDDGPDDRQSCGNRHDSTRRVRPRSLEHGDRSEPRSIVPTLEERGCGGNSEKEHRTE